MQTFQELMTQALTDAGYSDDAVTAALTKIYTHDKLGPRLNALVKTATEDYQAQLGRVKQYQDWYPKAQAEYDRMATAYNQAMQEIEQYRAIASGNGNGNGSGNGAPPAFDPTKYVSKDDLVALQMDMGRRYADVIKTTSEITAEHVARFKEKPDLEAVDRIAMEQRLPLRAAYEHYIKPRVEEETKVKNEEWKKQQREEIERDLRSRYKLPVEQAAPETSHLFAKQKPEDVSKDLDAELLDAWRSVPVKP